MMSGVASNTAPSVSSDALLPNTTDEMGTYLVDKLKNIRPFTESQLLSLHQIPQLDENDSFVDTFLQECVAVQDNTFYTDVAKLKKWKHSLARTRSKINEITGDCEEAQEQTWQLVRKSIKKQNRCNDGRTVEGSHVYHEANRRDEHVKAMGQGFLSLQETIANDFCYHLFMTQYADKNAQIHLKGVIDIPDSPQRVSELRRLISCLFAFLRLDDAADEFSKPAREWLSRLVYMLLPTASFEDRLFILNHVLRCCGGISSWATGFIQCPSPLDAVDADEAFLVLNHCLTVIHTILSPVRGRDKFLGVAESPKRPTGKDASDDLWLLVDAETEESEEVFASKQHFSEMDIISLLKQVPFGAVIKFITEGGKCLRRGPAMSYSFGDFSELTMLKLLAVATRIIQILKQGLNTFNCMRFKRLTEHITLLIKKTVRAVSRFWILCKEHLHSNDQAIILRLQVEYDHFILRAVITILESQRSGVWKFISVIPYNGVTEAMMWHILWVFYNNGRDELDELGGLCPYFSDSYWKAKFDEPAVKYLFREKLPALSVTECNSLLESMSNMAKSRSPTEHEFITTIVTEMLEMSFLLQHKNEAMAQKCTEMFSSLTRVHPFVVDSLIIKIKSATICSDAYESVVQCFMEMPLEIWKPETDTLVLLQDWLSNYSITQFFNKLARVILSKLNWGLDKDRKCLHLCVDVHREMAIQIYASSKMNVYVEDSEDPFNCTLFSGLDGKSMLDLAKSENPKAFVEWSWRLLLTLKLHAYEQPFITVGKLEAGDPSIIKSIPDFDSLPSVLLDTKLLPLSKGLDLENPFAIYIALSMTEYGHSINRFDANRDLLVQLMTSKNYIQSLTILSWFAPLYIESAPKLLDCPKFTTAFNQLILLEQNELLERFLGMIRVQFETHSNLKVKLLAFWSNLLFVTAEHVMKQWSTSWLLASSKGLQQIVYLLDSLIEITSSDDTLHNYLLKFVCDKPYDENFAKLMASSSILSWRPWSTSSSYKKCEWITPLHFLRQKYPKHIWLGWLVTKTDSRKMEKIWDDIVVHLNVHLDMQGDVAVKTVCSQRQVSDIPPEILPINSWADLIIEAPLDHSSLPILCYNFFVCFFSNSASGGSVGLRLIKDATMRKLKPKIGLLADYHHKEWATAADSEKATHHSENTKLYRAFLLWLEDSHLHDAFVDVVHLPPQYFIDILKMVMDASSEIAISKFVDHDVSCKREEQLVQKWLDIKDYDTNLTPMILNFDEVDEESSFAPEPCDEGKLECGETFLHPSNAVSETFGKDILPLLQHNIQSIMNETRYFENRVKKLTDLNTSFLDLIKELYTNKKKEITLKITCDRDGYDPDGCTGAAQIVFEFMEAIQSKQVSVDMDGNRKDFASVLLELLDTPSDIVVSSVIHIESCINILQANRANESCRQAQSAILGLFLSGIKDAATIIYPPTKHLFELLMDTISFENSELRDVNSKFLLETALNYPNLIEYFAPRLAPTECSPQCFLEMYQNIEHKLGERPATVIFVLLSKFDVSSWLKRANEDNISRFLKVMATALYKFGQTPSDDKSMNLGLYRKHLQYTVICRFPQYLRPVTEILLQGMTSFCLYPFLWNDFLLAVGFYLKPGLSLTEAIYEIKKYANNQPIFQANELHALLTELATHFSLLKQQQTRVEVLEYYKDYVKNFIVVLTTVSFMWINSNSRALAGNLENVWQPMYEAWKPWISPVSLDKLAHGPELDHVWTLYSANLQYFTECFFGLSSGVMSLTWQSLAHYLLESKSVYCTNLDLVQNHLKSLPWVRFVPSENDVELMFEAAYAERGVPSDILSHIIKNVKWMNATQYIAHENLPHAMERLAYVVVAIASTEVELPVDEIPLQVIPSSKALALCQCISRQFLLEDYFKQRSQVSKKLLLASLKKICNLNENSEKPHPDTPSKIKIYVNSIIHIMSDGVRSDPTFLARHMQDLQSFIKNLFEDVTLTLRPDFETNERKEILSSFMKFISSLTDQEQQILLLEPLRELLAQDIDPNVIMDCITASSLNLANTSVLVKFHEDMIGIYATAKGSVEKLSENYRPLAITSLEDYLASALSQNAALSLYLFLHKSKSDDNQVRYLSDTVEYACQLKPVPEVEPKVLLLWYNALLESTALVTKEDVNHILVRAILKMSKQLLSVADEVVSPGFMSFMKFGKAPISNRTVFLSLAVSALGVQHVNESVAEDNPVLTEVGALAKLVNAKLQTIKKSKAHAEWLPLIDKMIQILHAEEYVAREGISLLRSWLLSFYTEVSYLDFMLMSDQ